MASIQKTSKGWRAEVCVKDAACQRRTSGTDSLLSTRVSVSTIWLPENLDFFMQNSSLSRKF
jgi:hypothetical protein